MPRRSTPAYPEPGTSLAPPAYPAPLPAWGTTSILAEPEGVPWARYIEALRRNTLMIIAIVAIGSLAGLFFARRVKPIYDVQATVWITPSLPQQSGPIRAQQLLPATSWVELLRSFAIIDPVVHILHLNVTYTLPGDSSLFTNFESLPNLRPGKYVLRIIPGNRYVLALKDGGNVEKGTLGDSVGRRVGFDWVPDARLLAKRREVEFSVATPRSTSVALLSKLR